MSGRFPQIQKWILPDNVLPDSLKEMASDGAHGNEGIVLWLGKRSNGDAHITHLVGLRGCGIVKRPAQIVLDPSLVNNVTDLAIELGVILIGQIHSHGTYYGTDLSYTDREHGISFPSYLSLVAPHYAQRADTTLEDCGTHVFEPGDGFRRMHQSEVTQRVEIARIARAPLLLAYSDYE